MFPSAKRELHENTILELDAQVEMATITIEARHVPAFRSSRTTSGSASALTLEGNRDHAVAFLIGGD